MMAEKTIYETKGAGKRWVSMLVLAAFFLAIAVGCFALREMKNEPTTLRSGYVDSNGQTHWTDEKSGYWNGQVYVLTAGGRQAALIFGFVCLFLGGTCLDVGIGMNRCWLKVYETYIEGQSFTTGLRKNVFHFSTEQIESVHQVNGAVAIKAGAVHTVMCKDPEAVFQVLSQCKKQASTR